MRELVAIIPIRNSFSSSYTIESNIKLLLKPNGLKSIVLFPSSIYICVCIYYVYVYLLHTLSVYKNNFVALESAKCCFCLTQDDDHFCSVLHKWPHQDRCTEFRSHSLRSWLTSKVLGFPKFSGTMERAIPSTYIHIIFQWINVESDFPVIIITWLNVYFFSPITMSYVILLLLHALTPHPCKENVFICNYLFVTLRIFKNLKMLDFHWDCD
jgi:hypothetical protein